MTTKVAPYGNAAATTSISMVGKSKTPESPADLMPSADIAAKVGILLAGQVDARTVRRKFDQA